MNKTVIKFVFPMIDADTRFLSATRVKPTEMLASIDKPLIQYAAEVPVTTSWFR